MTGMPPATAASYFSGTPAVSAASASSSPWWASIALFAVTNGLPCASVARASASAGPSLPPISSTTTSTSSRAASCVASSTQANARQVDAAVAAAVARGDGGDDDRPAGAALDQRGIGVEQA